LQPERDRTSVVDVLEDLARAIKDLEDECIERHLA
jgi:hypothetical protein